MIFGCFYAFYSQSSIVEAWTMPTPWSIGTNFYTENGTKFVHSCLNYVELSCFQKCFDYHSFFLKSEYCPQISKILPNTVYIVSTSSYYSNIVQIFFEYYSNIVKFVILSWNVFDLLSQMEIKSRPKKNSLIIIC